jgi:hypothetical protein
MSEVKNQVREALELASKELLIAQASLAEYANILSREPYEADRAYDAHTEVAAAIAAVVRSQALDELVAISQKAGLYDDPAPDVPSSEEIEAIRARHEACGHIEEWPDFDSFTAHTDRATLLRLLDAAREELREDYAYAKQLLLLLHAKHFPDGSPDFEALPDLGGVLTQIDNLTTALTRAQGESS